MGTVSFDISRAGRTKFYVFDENQSWETGLSLGINPFIAEDVSHVNGTLGSWRISFSEALLVERG
jgi:hypothetical protein